MPFLRIVQGGRPGELHELTSERIVLGRHPNCEVVLDNAVISRQHARLILKQGQYTLEDLGSRNGTYVNGKPISGLHPIKNGDRLRICDYVLEYLDQLPDIDDSHLQDDIYDSGLAGQKTRVMRNQETIDQLEDSPELESSSSIIITMNAGAQAYRYDVQPEVKLKAVLDLSRLFSRTIDLPTVLNKTLECLFDLFPHADLGVILLNSGPENGLEVEAARNARGQFPENLQISSTIIERAVESQEAILSEDIRDDTRFSDSASASSLEIRSLMCTPLSGVDEVPFGAIQLTTRDLRKVFTQDDLDLMISISAQAAMAVENANLHAEMLQRTEMEHELEVATQIQLGFLPNKMPQFQGLEFHHYYQAAQQVGGDYFDYVPLPDGRLAVAVGDVSGKGVPAALLMARLCSAVRYHLVAQKNIADAMTELNRELLEGRLGFRFITLVIAVFEPDTNQVTIVNAGHLPPLVHDGKQSYYLEGDYSGLPLGIGGEKGYEELKWEFPTEASLLFYTDGITETENSADELYGRERLLVDRPAGTFSAGQLVEHVLQKTAEFSENEQRRDDCCVVAVKNLSAEA